MQTFISYQATHVYCQWQELFVSVLCKCKSSAIIAHLTITLVPYGTDIPQNCHFLWGS